METMFAAFMSLMTPQCILLMFLGSIVGIIVGALPGLGVLLAIPIILPMTFSMEPVMGLAVLISVWIGGVSGGFVSAVLLGIPGTTASIATCFDGYPMSKRGEPIRALGIGIMGSFIGTFFSTFIAMFASPAIARLTLKLGPWEMGALCICAITMVIGLSEKNIFKGLAGAFLGLIMGCIGSAPMDGQVRFDMDIVNLSSGINLTALMMGIFAVRMIVMDHGKGLKAYDVPDLKVHGLGIKLKDITSSIKCIVWTFTIGLWIGFLPGMGSSLSNLVAYSQAKKLSKTPEEFGKGAPEGIWASEVSNNASVGGALIPMCAMGIPGDAVTAILLGALMIHGLEPGPLLFDRNPTIVYALFLAVIFSALLTMFLEFGGMRLFPHILKIPYHYLYTAVFIFAVIGAYSSTKTMFNVGEMMVFGIIGMALVLLDIPLTPMLLSFILGPMIEKYVRRAYSYSKGDWSLFLTRPISAILLLIAIAVVLMPVIKKLWAKYKQSKAEA